jgi:phosphoribosylanthranilate isomerase
MNAKGDKSKTFIKICGITREQDARDALDLGVDAIGLVFFEASPRFVSTEKAIQLSDLVKNDALIVGLFVNAEAGFVRQVLDHVPLDILQFHGDESPEYCEQFKRSYWKALRVKDSVEVASQIQAHANASAILLDAWHQEQYGGTGETFDWDLIKDLKFSQNLMLAGGLNPQNAAQAIKQIRPWGVDVSSGVEESPGLKSAVLMKQFIEEVRSV